MTSRTLGSVAPPPETVWRRLGRLLVSTAVLAGSAAYVWTHNPALLRPAASEAATIEAPTPVTAAAPPAMSPPPDEPAPAAASAEQPHPVYHDGEFRGNNAYAYFGEVMVGAVIENGRLVDVKVIRYPDDRKASDDISSPALVVLRRQALERQTAKVDIVSGATMTSMGYAESLTVALRKSAR